MSSTSVCTYHVIEDNFQRKKSSEADDQGMWKATWRLLVLSTYNPFREEPLLEA